jgi:Ser/Thr protein kinase RdoA (MazF antagonist)
VTPSLSLAECRLQDHLGLWPAWQHATARLINVSENETYLLTRADGARACLRLHRPHYHSRAAIESELVWLTAVRRDTTIPVPKAVPGVDGLAFQTLLLNGEQRFAVLFAFMEGTEPTLHEDATALFRTLGQHAAILHRHARSWQRPPSFERPHWTAATILDPDAAWGNWRDAPGVPPHRDILDTLDATLRGKLRDYGEGEHRFGLIHADMRLGNLLVDGKTVAVIDFDDCGYGWFAYDFAASISFHEGHPAVPALFAAWRQGYTEAGARPAQTNIYQTMVMLRRMALLAWIGTHGETALAQAHAPDFAENTALLARRYLDGQLWPEA